MSRYRLYVHPAAFKEMKLLPGHVRQRVRRAVAALADDPRGPDTQALGLPPDLQHETDREPRRLRLDRWRIVYLICEADQAVEVLAVRKRPPYDYGDLKGLLGSEEGASSEA